MPWQFWRLTPREYTVMKAGVLRRDDRAWDRVAMLGVWILSPWVGKNKTMTKEKLLNNRRLRLWPTEE